MALQRCVAGRNPVGVPDRADHVAVAPADPLTASLDRRHLWGRHLWGRRRPGRAVQTQHGRAGVPSGAGHPVGVADDTPPRHLVIRRHVGRGAHAGRGALAGPQLAHLWTALSLQRRVGLRGAGHRTRHLGRRGRASGSPLVARVGSPLSQHCDPGRAALWLVASDQP